ncbi:unnamed protein product [Leptidea sinapis]|uniref:Protein krueppel n=1 Tax=Leptidea sinapis TaxID=189913 RepID=A0A5E4PP07_9NEOP|nr:unnamed protein product [Leptidea sinapis]
MNGETQTANANSINLPDSEGTPDEPDDFSNVCRICAVKTHSIIPVFGKEGIDLMLADKINNYLPIKILEQDLLPVVVCEQCCSAVQAWHELVECCVQAEHSLRKRLTWAFSRMKRAGTTDIDEKTLTAEASKCVLNSETLTTDHFVNETNDDDSFDIDNSDEDEPLSKIVAKNSSASYRRLYDALVQFRDHLANDHKRDCSDLTESSSSEEDNTMELDVDKYDDLSKHNKRRDRLDDTMRLELNKAQTRVNGKVYYECTVCGKKLSAPHTYIFHKMIHTGERSSVCHVCGKTFRAPNGLQRHLVETHERIKRYVCVLCSKIFVNSQNLRQHMRIHTGERPYVCSQCGKRFRQSGSLHVHLKTHSDLFPFTCTECGAHFRLRSGLSKHQLKHTGERPHSCETCGKGFRQKHELNNHALTHSDAKPYACTVCGATFRQRRALRHHIKRLHETKDIPQQSYDQNVHY